MTKRPNKKSTPTQWIEALDLEAIDEAREEACVDAHDELRTVFGNDRVAIVAMEWPVLDSKTTTTTENWTEVIREVGVHFFMAGSCAAALCTERTLCRT